MKQPHHPAIRALLRQNENGLTMHAIMKALPDISSESVLRRCLENMPDAYIDRWVDPIRGQWRSVWCIVVPPEHCPYPTDRFKPETRWVDSSYHRNRASIQPSA